MDRFLEPDYAHYEVKVANRTSFFRTIPHFLDRRGAGGREYNAVRMAAIVLEVLAVFVIPVVINKTTEDRFHGIKPYLREIWFGIVVIFLISVVLRPEGEKFFMSFQKSLSRDHPVASYVAVGSLGMVLFVGYWWFLGTILPGNATAQQPQQTQQAQQGEDKKPDVQQNSKGNNSPNTSITGNNNTVTNKITVNTPAAPTKPPQPKFRENTGDKVYFSLGEHGMTFGTSIERLRQMPWAPFVLTNSNGSAATVVTLWARENTILVTTKVGIGLLGPLIEVHDNEFRISDPNFDRNSNEHALEVVNSNGQPIFQLIEKSPNHIVLNGVFPVPDGSVILATPDGTIMNANEAQIANFHLKTIFKYPAWKYPGQFAD